MFISPNWKTITAITLSTIAVAGVVYYLNFVPAPLTVQNVKSKKKRSDAKKKQVLPAESASNPEKAKAAKNAGNKLFTEKKYEDAIVKYSEAISLDAQAVYFNNRAACYFHLHEYEKVIADCTEALKRDPVYIKALSRRAQAYEALSEHKSALDDYSALCVLEEFKNQASMTNADRVLQAIGTKKAAELLADRPERLPSDSFVTAYMESFRQSSANIPDLLKIPVVTDSDIILHDALQAILDKKYSDAMNLCSKAIANGKMSTELEGIAYNLRGTFKFLVGKTDDALVDFEKTITLDPENIDAYIKRASVFMEQGKVEQTLQEFELAEKIDSSSGDFYYHRGQVRHLTGSLESSVSDFKRALQLDPALVYAQIQLGVALYKSGDISGAISAFKDAEAKFPGRAEVLNYQGEIFLDQGDQDKALKCFDKSIEMQANSALPFINKGMLYLQLRGDPLKAEEMFKKAIELDPMSDIAYGPLAQLYLTQNKIQEAIEVYDRAIENARSEQEITAALCCREAAISQLSIAKNHPVIMKKLQEAQMHAMGARAAA